MVELRIGGGVAGVRVRLVVGELGVGALEVHAAQSHLLHVVDALGTAGGLAGRLHRRQQQGDQDRDDRDHDQKLDQGEARAIIWSFESTFMLFSPVDQGRGRELARRRPAASRSLSSRHRTVEGCSSPGLISTWIRGLSASCNGPSRRSGGISGLSATTLATAFLRFGPEVAHFPLRLGPPLDEDLVLSRQARRGRRLRSRARNSHLRRPGRSESAGPRSAAVAASSRWNTTVAPAAALALVHHLSVNRIKHRPVTRPARPKSQGECHGSIMMAARERIMMFPPLLASFLVPDYQKSTYRKLYIQFVSLQPADCRRVPDMQVKYR